MRHDWLIQWQRRGGVVDGWTVSAEQGADAPDRAVFPLLHGVPRVDDRRIVSAIIYVIKHGLMWRDAPKDYGPHKTVDNPVQSLSKGASSAGAG